MLGEDAYDLHGDRLVLFHFGELAQDTFLVLLEGEVNADDRELGLGADDFVGGDAAEEERWGEQGEGFDYFVFGAVEDGGSLGLGFYVDDCFGDDSLDDRGLGFCLGDLWG